MKNFSLAILSACIFWSATGHGAEAQIDNTRLQNEYASAYENWRKLPLDLNANLTFAQAAMQNAYFDIAMAAYDRVLILDEHNIEAQIQISKIYINEQNLELAAIQLQNIDTAQLNAEQQQQVASLRQYVSQQTESLENTHTNIRAFNKSISIGMLYDSNIYGDIGAKKFVLPAYNLDYQGNVHTAKMAAFEMLHIDTDLNLNPKFTVNTAFDLYNKNYFAKDNAQDLLSIRGQLTPRYLIGNLEVSHPLAVNGVFLANKNYANIFSAGINLYKSINNKQFGLAYKHEAYRFNQNNSDKNAHKNHFEAQLAYIKNKNTALYGKLHFGINKENENKRTDVNYRQTGFVVGLNYKINTRLSSKAAIAYDAYHYTDQNKVFLNKRQDKVFGIDLGVDYAINNKSTLAAEFNHQTNSSNQFLYHYDKTMLSMNYIYSF